MSSNCTGTLVREIPNVPPSANTRDEDPFWISTNFNPNTDRGRIVAVESTGTLPFALSNFNVNSAPT